MLRNCMFLLYTASALSLSFLSGCEHANEQRKMFGDVSFRVVSVELPYDRHKERCLLGKSPYNVELRRSEKNIVLPFGVVCGGCKVGTAGLFAEIALRPKSYSLLWKKEEVLRYSFAEKGVLPQAYKLIMTDSDTPSGGDLVCREISLLEASMIVTDLGREQIIVFSPNEVLIKKGDTGFFSCVKAISSEGKECQHQ